MTDLFNGQLTDLITNESAYNPKIQALSYALAKEKQRILVEADKTRTLAMITRLPEGILDVLAVELRSPYYTADMSLEQKREAIVNALVLFFKAGTPSAVAEMAAMVFGAGSVVEWFNFDPNDGEIVPGEFDLETGSEMQDPSEFMVKVSRIIGRVKNTRSHLRSVRFLRKIHNPEYAAALAMHYNVKPISNVVSLRPDANVNVNTATFAQAFQTVTIC